MRDPNQGWGPYTWDDYDKDQAKQEAQQEQIMADKKEEVIVLTQNHTEVEHNDLDNVYYPDVDLFEDYDNYYYDEDDYFYYDEDDYYYCGCCSCYDDYDDDGDYEDEE